MSKCLIITWFAIYKNWTLWYKGWVQWAETSAHQPCDAEDGHREPRQAHTSLWCRGQTQGAQTSAHKPMMQRPGTGIRDQCPPASRCRGWARGAQTSAHKPVTQRLGPWSWDKGTGAPQHSGVSSGGWGTPTEIYTTQRAQSGSQKKIHTNPYPASFGQQCRAGQGNRSIAMSPGTSQGLAAVETCWEGHFGAAVEIEVSNTAGARRTAQTHTGPTETAAHCKEEIQLHQPEHRHKLPQPGKHHKEPTRPHPRSRLHSQEVRPSEPFFFFPSFFLINHPVYSPYIVSRIFSDHNTVRLDINYREKLQKTQTHGD